MIYTDNARVPIDGRIGRVICDKLRQSITEGSDEFGAFLRFAPLKGDVSSTDAARDPPPSRAMIALEAMGDVPRYGKRLTQHFGLVVEPGPTVKPGAYCVIAQWNAGGTSWRPPPCEFGNVAVERLSAAGKGLRTAAGKPVYDEFLELKVHALDAAGQQIDSIIRSNAPLVRGTRYGIGIAFYDGRGGPGRAELWINGRQQGKTWRGPSGYAGYGSAFPAFGSYNHPGQCSPPPAVRIYGWREGPHA